METVVLPLVGGREMESQPMIQITNALFSQTTPLKLVSLLLQGQQDLCESSVTLKKTPEQHNTTNTIYNLDNTR